MKNTTGTSTKIRRFSVPRGKIGPAATVLVAQAASLLAVIVVFYIVAFFAAVRVVPMVMGFVKDGTGITMDMPVETVLSAWIAPSLFLLALVFALVLFVLRAVWKLRTTAITALSAWAFGREEVRVAAIDRGQVQTKKKKRTATAGQSKTA